MAAILLGATLSVTSSVHPGGGTAADAFPTDAIGRLLVNGRFVCTAFAIRSEEGEFRRDSEQPTYRNWLVTAGHCVHQLIGGGSLGFLPGLQGGRHARAHMATLAGFSAARPWGYDIAALIYWTPHPVPVLVPSLTPLLRPGEWLLTAGFSRGVLSYAVGGYLGANDDDLLLVDASLAQGSSGSPVLHLGTHTVVGVVVEGTAKQSPGAASGCLIARCAADRPTLAAPIDWVLRVMRW